MRIKRFEDLECWREARGLVQTIYGFTKQDKFSKDFRLCDQITGAAISIMNNISEGFDARSTNDFIRFLVYSRCSCSEVQNCLYIALDQNYVGSEDFETGYGHCRKIRQIIDGLIRYLKHSHSPQRPNGPTGKRANG